MRRLASFARVIVFDKRGTGLSDRVAGIATLEERMDDVRAAFRTWLAIYVRASISPGAASMLSRMNRRIDIRPVLPTIGVPTLVLHHKEDVWVPVEDSRFLAEQIPGAKYVELAGADHLPWVVEAEAVPAEVEEFLTGTRHAPEPDRVLATICFTDIVDSTRRAAELGDRRWCGLLERYHDLVRRQLGIHRGRELDIVGDGFLAAFDGAARAIRFAMAVRDEVRLLGLEIRAGLHTGECERIGDKLAGLAVHIGARVAGLASPAEVFVSSTVRDLVAGSSNDFQTWSRLSRMAAGRSSAGGPSSA